MVRVHSEEREKRVEQFVMDIGFRRGFLIGFGLCAFIAPLIKYGWTP
jgi:hypothetical protein